MATLLPLASTEEVENAEATELEGLKCESVRTNHSPNFNGGSVILWLKFGTLQIAFKMQPLSAKPLLACSLSSRPAILQRTKLSGEAPEDTLQYKTPATGSEERKVSLSDYHALRLTL